MTDRLIVTGFAGSLRKGSYSKVLLDECARLLPDGSDFATVDIGAIPHYDEDLDHADAPTAVRAARERVAASDVLIVVTPEFNHGIPGVLKNAFDWLSRPAFRSPMAGKPVLFATHSPGALGGVRTQYQLRETFASMLCRLIPLPEIAVTHIGAKVSEGRVCDEETLAFLDAQVKRFLAAL
ncbi:NADPH-dependent FMN reductase [Novosphingobium nitrogenifigens DSM 19370]|uniref:NADPH-dependent FMN reductase n=1 Tax=Novosphingobium nitrogenifigens DSM 19370 TaxID=983920 RepID=F1Z7A8_9SPHN|nr:NADPH-dependent FMN reductase [Novosphingobium nitrogenifigens]EGD59526.1 NADPH-dependent FMN reductase [Novosphingobium nitrogenifigens DSM 19370]